MVLNYFSSTEYYIDKEQHSNQNNCLNKSKGEIMKIKQYLTIVFSFLFLLTANNSFAQITLKASHQFPGGKGDARDEMVQILAKEVEKANVGIKIQVYPGQSLYKAMEQF
jgi:TRAP-type C4-dicarboxylate transport system substrate-binding protein